MGPSAAEVIAPSLAVDASLISGGRAIAVRVAPISLPECRPRRRGRALGEPSVKRREHGPPISRSASVSATASRPRRPPARPPPRHAGARPVRAHDAKSPTSAIFAATTWPTCWVARVAGASCGEAARPAERRPSPADAGDGVPGRRHRLRVRDRTRGQAAGRAPRCPAGDDAHRRHEVSQQPRDTQESASFSANLGVTLQLCSKYADPASDRRSGRAQSRV